MLRIKFVFFLVYVRVLSIHHDFLVLSATISFKKSPLTLLLFISGVFSSIMLAIYQEAKNRVCCALSPYTTERYIFFFCGFFNGLNVKKTIKSIKQNNVFVKRSFSLLLLTDNHHSFL